MAPKPHRLPQITTPTRARFECTACGHCCRDWSVTVDRATYENLAQLLVPGPANPKGYSRAGTASVQPDAREQAYASFRHVDGACIFLDEDNLCYLHKQFGYEAKPKTCRSFPTQTIRFPDADHIVGTFACHGMTRTLDEVAVSADLVPAPATFGTVRPDLVVQHAGIVRWTRAEQRGFDADGFTAFMRGLRSLVSVERSTVDSRILLARMWIEELFTGADLLAASAVDESRAAFGLEADELLARNAQQPAVPGLQIELLLLLIRLSAKAGQWKEPMRTWMAHAATRYRFDQVPPAKSERLWLTDLSGPSGQLAPEVMRLLVNYVVDKLYFHFRYFELGVLPGFHALVYVYALVRFVAIAEAAYNERPVTVAGLTAAIEAVEREFGHQLPIFHFWHDPANVQTLKLQFVRGLLGMGQR